MGRALKAGVDWPKIRKLFIAGETANSLGKRFPISKQAILARAKRECWKRGTIAAQHKSVVVATYPGLVDTIAASPEKLDSIVQGYGQGLSQNVIAALAGLAGSTVANWRDKDSAFDVDCEAAAAAYLATINGHITTASPRDWRASEAILRRHALTRDEYQEAPAKTPQIIIRVERAILPGEESVLIDITPDQADTKPGGHNNT